MYAAVKFAELKGVYPRADVMFAAVKFAELKGVYPRADVIFADDRENTAVRDDRPSLFKVRVLDVEVVSEKAIDVT